MPAQNPQISACLPCCFSPEPQDTACVYLPSMDNSQSLPIMRFPPQAPKRCGSIALLTASPAGAFMGHFGFSLCAASNFSNLQAEDACTPWDLRNQSLRQTKNIQRAAERPKMREPRTSCLYEPMFINPVGLRHTN